MEGSTLGHKYLRKQDISKGYEGLVEKGRKFLQGLRIEFQQLMSLVHVESYADIVFKAMTTEENMMHLAELKAMTVQTGGQLKKSNLISRPWDRKIVKKGKACSRCNKRHPGKKVQRTKHCLLCLWTTRAHFQKLSKECSPKR